MRAIQNLITFIVLERASQFSRNDMTFPQENVYLHVRLEAIANFYVPSEHGGVERYKSAETVSVANMLIGYRKSCTPRVFCDIPSLVGAQKEEVKNYFDTFKTPTSFDQPFFLISEHDSCWKYDGLERIVRNMYYGAVAPCREIVKNELGQDIAPVQINVEYDSSIFGFPKWLALKASRIPNDWIPSETEKRWIIEGLLHGDSEVYESSFDEYFRERFFRFVRF